MTRAISVPLAAGFLVAVAVCVACSHPASDPKPVATSPAAPAAVLVVGVGVAPGGGPEADAWAKELRTAVGARDELRLAAEGGAADIVVRIEKVQRDAKPTPEPPGEGEVVVMQGSLTSGERTHEFTLSYRGAARPQAESLARNLRAIEKDMSAPIPEASPKSSSR